MDRMSSDEHTSRGLISLVYWTVANPVLRVDWKEVDGEVTDTGL